MVAWRCRSARSASDRTGSRVSRSNRIRDVLISAVLTPGGRHFSPTAGRVGDGQPAVVEPLEHEDQVLPDEQAASVSLGQRLVAGRSSRPAPAATRAASRWFAIDALDGLEEGRQVHRVQQHGDQPAGGRPVLGQERGPLVRDPRALERLRPRSPAPARGSGAAPG